MVRFRGILTHMTPVLYHAVGAQLGRDCCDSIACGCLIGSLGVSGGRVYH